MQEKIHGELEIFDKIEGMKLLLEDDKIQNYMWNKLFKRKLFENIRFPLGKNFEDIAIMHLLFKNSEIIVNYEVPKYYYLRREDSTVRNKVEKTYRDCIDVVLERYMHLYITMPELRDYNAYNFITLMLWVYTVVVTYELNGLKQKTDQLLPMFDNLLTKYGQFIWNKLNPYQRAILSMILYDKELSNEHIKQYYFANRMNEQKVKFILK